MTNELKMQLKEALDNFWLRVKSLFGGLDTRVTNIEQGTNIVTGVKGNAESTYRHGNVNLTAANIGALPSNTTFVSGVKGNAENSYRSGDVNLTAANIGAKGTQSAVSDPTVNGTSLSFIDSISQNAQGVIAPTKKFVKTMTGASSGSAGAGGLVPQPAAGDNAKFLKGDGTWATPSWGAVTGVKGDKENSYRTGNVNLTPADIGALPDTTTIPSKTSDLTNDGDGTSRFATMDDLTGGAGNPDIRMNGVQAVSTLLAVLSGMSAYESRTFYADAIAMLIMSERKIHMSSFGVLVRDTSGYDYSFIAADSYSGAHFYIGHFSIDAQQSTLTATAYSILGTAL